MTSKRNSTTFPLTISNILANLPEDEFLRKHQVATTAYFLRHLPPDARGILVMQETGSGKSLIGSYIAHALAHGTYGRRYKVIMLMAKTLQANFRDSIKKVIQQYSESSDPDGEIDRLYKFVTMNASNMHTQFVNATSNSVIASENLDLENTCIIIDEAHNFFNSITNGSENAIKLYNSIQKSKNIRLVFMTATPIVNHPFELVPCFNMLGGPGTLPDLFRDFEQLFMDPRNGIRHKEHFQNRITGLVSYFGQIGKAETSKELPEEKPIRIENVSMSIYQYQMYETARDKEREEGKFARESSAPLVKPKSVFSSSYRVRSRQISNFAPPKAAANISKGRIVIDYSKITTEELRQLDTYSPKIKKLLENIKKEKGIGIVYTQFVESGVELIGKILQLHGYTPYHSKEYLDDGSATGGKSLEKYFITISGQVDAEERDRLVKLAKRENNKHGEVIPLILLSSAGSEGVDFKYIRHIHILEPTWNWAKIRQIIGRGVRFRSHAELPASERNVKPYIYVSDYPKAITTRAERTTDIDILTKAININRAIKKFYMALAESAVDCTVNTPHINCRLCNPDDKPLFSSNVYNDVKSRAACTPLKTENIKATKIAIGDKVYYYTREDGNIHVFEDRPDLGGFAELSPSDPMYSTIINKIN